MRRRALALAVSGLLVTSVAALATVPDDPPATRAATPAPTSTSSSTSTSTSTTTTTTTAVRPATTAPRPRTTLAPRPTTTRKPAPAAPAPSGTGVIAAFYYGWYPHGFSTPGTHYHPIPSVYDSTQMETVRRHIDQMRYAGMQAGIASWWGPGQGTDQAFAAGLAAAAGTPFKWSIYYEPEGPAFADPGPDQLRASLQYLYDHYASHANYLRVDGRPVIFVWPDGNDRCDMLARWRAADTMGWHVVQKRFPGHTACSDQPQSWHDYAPAHATVQVAPWSFSVSPGFWKTDEGAPRLARNPATFEAAVRSMAASSAMWKLLTTFNEWGEGTAAEPATEWASASGYGVYLDVLHNVLGSR